MDEYSIMEVMHELYRYGMKRNYGKLEHVKKYRKLRKKHSEIIQKMYDTFNSSQSLQDEMSCKVEEYLSHPNCKADELSLNLHIDNEKRLFIDLVVYANYKDNNMCTYFIKNKKVRSRENIDFINAMNESKLGVYEIVECNRETAQGKLRNVLTNEIITLIDESMFLYENNNFFQVLRVITINGISFQTGLSLPFEKNHLRKWVKNHKNRKIKPHELINLYKMNENEKLRIQVY